MIFGINYNTDGTRYIAFVGYDISLTDTQLGETATKLSSLYDELYIMNNFNPNNIPLMEEVILHGCKIS